MLYGVNQLLYDNWLSNIYIMGSQTCLNKNNQITQMWKDS